MLNVIKDDKKEKIMRKTKKKLFKRVLTGVVAATLCIGSVSMAAPPAGYEKHDNVAAPYQVDAGAPLGTATRFHVFAQEAASISAHCNGNLATKVLGHSVNSGSNVVYSEVTGAEYTYFRELNGGNLNFGQYGTKVVFGRDMTVWSKNNGAEFYLGDSEGNAIDGTQILVKDKNENIYVEDKTEYFIDLDEEFEKLNKLSKNIAGEEDSTGVVFDKNNNVVTLPADGTETLYLNLKTSDLMNRAFEINNANFLKGQALVINVDLGTATSYTLPFTQVVLRDTAGNKFGTGEDKKEYTGYGNILWNFYGRDAQGNVVPYSGTVTTSNEFIGTVLAPSATIKTPSSNQDGNFIGKEVHLGGGETHRWDFGGKLKTYADATGSIKVVVKANDKDNKVGPMADVVLEVKDSTGKVVGHLTTDALGETDTIEDLKIGDTYTVTVTDKPYGYVGDLSNPTAVIAEDQEISDANPDVVEFLLLYDAKQFPADKGYFHITVKEQETGELISGAKINITNTNNSAYTSETLTTADGVAVSDKQDLVYEDDHVTLKTTENTYTIKLTVPEGYELVTEGSDIVEKQLTDANPDKVNFVLKKEEVPTGSITVYVYEDGTTTLVKGVEGQITDVNGLVKDITTSENISTSKADNIALLNDYKIEIDETTIPENWQIKDSAVKTGVNLTETSPDKTVVFYIEKQKGSLIVEVVDQNGDTVQGAKITVYDEDGNVVDDTLITGNTGETTKLTDLIKGDEYKVVITDPSTGYELTDVTEKTQVITGGATVDKVTLEVKKEATTPATGSMEVVITDEKTGDPIPGATVEIKDEDGNVIKTVVTDSTGKTPVVDKLTVGKDYTVHVNKVPDEYSAPEDKKVSITDTTKKEVALVVSKDSTTPATGSMEVVITDEKTGEPIPGATVEIKDEDGNVIKTVVTDSTGKTPVIDELTVGKDYTVHVKEVPDEYNPPADKTVSITDTTKKEVELVVSKEPATGSITVTITDKNTGAVIPEATVVVKDPAGNIVSTQVTGANGVTPVIDKLLVGTTYTIETTKVPSGYTAPSPTTHTIKTTTTENVPLTVGRDSGVESSTGSLFVIITDKNTGAVIPGAEVKVTDSKDNVVNLIKTDEKGTFTITQMKPDTYTITTITVPGGYTAPEPETAVVVANARTDKHLYVVMGASTSVTEDKPNTDNNVQTGDNSNAPLAAGLGLFAIAGIVFVSLKRRKMEM